MSRNNRVKILLDLRCLNYKLYTGVNSYCLHFLHNLFLVKQNHQVDWEVAAVGLKESRRKQIIEEFDFLEKLCDQFLSLKDYVKCRVDDNKFVETAFIIKARFTRSLNFSMDFGEVDYYDFIFMPQPRLLPVNKNSKLVSVFHDVFSLINPSKSIAQNFVQSEYNLKLITERSDCIWVNSIATGLDIQKLLKVKEEKIKLIYPATPDLDSLRSKDYKKTQDKNETFEKIESGYILAISGIEVRKNWLNLILAHQYLQQKYKDWDCKLVLAGSIVDKDYYHRLQKLIHNENIKNIIWIISPSEKHKKELLKNCLFLVYPSLYEGFGFPILEAQSYKKVVLTSKVSSTLEVGKTSCMFINPLDHKDIANGMYILSKDDNYRESLSQNCQKDLNYFDWTQMQKSFKELLIDISQSD